MDLIKRYVYAVTKELPESQREEIRLELTSLIEDMVQERGEGSVESILLELGDPKRLAEKYREKPKYLIGPKYFDEYLEILKIVMIVMAAGITLSFVFQGIMDYTSIPQLMGKTIQNLIIGGVQVFAWVTIAFALIDRHDDGKKKPVTKEWKLSDLPKVSTEQDRISRGETIFGIIISTFFLIIFVFFPHLIAVYFRSEAGDFDKVPIFNLSVIDSYIWLFVIAFLLGQFSNILKFISGRWTLKLSIFCSALELVGSALMLLFILNPKIWNSEFLTHEFVQGWEHYITLGRVSAVISMVVIVVTAIEVGVMIYKGYRADNRRY